MTNRHDADRLANEWLVEETVELAEDQFLILPLDGQDHHFLDKNEDGHLKTLADHRIVG